MLPGWSKGEIVGLATGVDEFLLVRKFLITNMLGHVMNLMYAFEDMQIINRM